MNWQKNRYRSMEQNREHKLIWTINYDKGGKNIQNVQQRKYSLFSKLCWGNMGYFLMLCTKINSKCIKDLNVRSETIKVWKTQAVHSDMGLSINFWIWPLRQRKQKQNKTHYIKLNILHTEETINKMKRPPTKWEKISANGISNMGLICKIYRDLIQLNIKKKKKEKPDYKLSRGPEQYFSQEDTQMANRHIRTCSTSLIIR